MRKILGPILVAVRVAVWVAVWAGPIAMPAAAESGGPGKGGQDKGGQDKGGHGSDKKAPKAADKASGHGSSAHGKPEDDKAAAGAASREARGDRLPATEFVTMSAFTVPLMIDGKVTDQFTVVVALELADEDMREEVVKLTPFLRNEIYDLLFKSVTFRKGEPRDRKSVV